MGKTYQFTFVSSAEDCGIVFYDRKTGRESGRAAFSAADRIGKKYRLCAEVPESGCLYQFYEGDERRPDPLGKSFYSRKKYGALKSPQDIYTVLEDRAFDWQGAENPRIPYHDSIVYCLHVRGFTRHPSSQAAARGTFGGVVEKIPYLRSIGVTTLEFQPLYEFVERPYSRKKAVGAANTEERLPEELELPETEPLLNYWGYTQGFYYAPKADYAQGDPVEDCKTMIRELHRSGMEAVLQFYFPKEYNPMEIPAVLRFWVEEYHVDGFHLIGEALPVEQIAGDPELADTKIWYYQCSDEAVYGKYDVPARKTLALVRDDYLYDIRRFLRGDENCVPAVMYHLRAIPARMGQIHYLSDYWGFTLMDMVSYDYKHNEANREENRDGSNYNCSWNCGEEGSSRKKKILKLRLQQLRNAYCLLFFSQSTPRIFMGDEFGNSQKGNNNPYCQDNSVTWLDWRDQERHSELLSFFRSLVELRHSLPILHPAEEAKMMDTISCGYPDLSFHGQTAWRPQLEGYSRKLGVMYCGLYGKKDGEFLYLAMNMHQEPQELALPRLAKGKKWKLSFSTCEEMRAGEKELTDVVKITPRTIALYISEEKEPAAVESPAAHSRTGRKERKEFMYLQS